MVAASTACSLMKMLPSFMTNHNGRPFTFFAALQITDCIYRSRGHAASCNWLCIFVPEDQACSVEPWSAEDDDLARASV